MTKIPTFRSALEAGRWAPRPVLAMGNFETMHIGHRQLIQSAVQEAQGLRVKCLVLSFDPHPQEFFNPGSYHPLLSLDEKLELLGEWGVAGAVLLPFDQNLACLAPEAFMRDILVNQLAAAAIWIGADFCFGKDRSGRTAALESFGRDNGFTLHSIPLINHGGKKISSSRIRQLIREGRIKEAETLLGRPLPEPSAHADRLWRDIGEDTR